MKTKAMSKKWTLALVLCISVLALSLCLGTIGFAADESGEPSVPETPVVAKITGLSVNGYTLIGGYWRIAEDGDYAFYQGMSLSEANKRITGVSVEMSDGTTKTLPIGSSTEDGVAFDVSVSTSASDTGNNATDNVVLNYDARIVIDGDEENALTSDCELNFIADKEYALVLVGDVSTSGMGLTSSSLLIDYASALEVKVSYKFTSGRIGRGLVAAEFATQDSLTPSGDILEQVIANPTVHYSKEIAISDKNNTAILPVKVTVTDIAYSPLVSVSAITGTMAQQTARMPFDYNGLYFIFQDADGFDINVPVTDLLKYCTVSFKTTSGQVIEGTYAELVRTVNQITIKYSIPTAVTDENPAGILSGTRSLRFTVDQKLLEQPQISDLNPTFQENGVTVSISDFLQDGLNPIDISVSHGLTVDENNQITFLQGGSYTVTVSLAKGEEGDYAWLPTSGDNPARTKYVLTYTITVSNAPVEVTLTYTDTADREYGDGEPSRNVALNYAGGSEISNAIIQGSAVDDTSNTGLPSYELRYYGTINGVTYSGEMGENEQIGVTYTTTRPTALGTYHVYAATGATNKYAAGRSAAVEFEITARKLEAANLTTTKPYTGSAYTVADFVNINSYRTDGKPMFAEGDSVESVINMPTTTFVHVKDSTTVSLTLKSGNYVWASGNTSENVTITITKASMNFSIYQPELIYGDLVKDNLATLNTGNLQFGVTIDDSRTKYEITTDGTTWNTVPDTSAVWDAGSYRVTYYTKDKTGGTGGDAADDDYNLPSVTQEFAIKHISIDKAYIASWSADDSAPYQFGVYGTTHNIVIRNWLANNTSPVGTQILTSVISGTRLDGTTAISGITDSQTGTISLTQAGTYQVTVTLNTNYKWTDGTNGDVVLYGSIGRQTVSNVTLSNGVTYDGADHSVNVQVSIGGSSLSWATDLLNGNAVVNIDSVDGQTFAAKVITGSLAVTGDNQAIFNDDGHFVVKYAGDYKVTLSLNDTDNYEWASETDIEATYTVAQAQYAGTYDYDGNPYPFVAGADSQSEPNFSMTAVADNETAQSDVDSITPLFTLYDIDFKALNPQKVTVAGTFYKVVTSLTSSDNSHLNYFVDEEDIGTTDRKVSVMFVINSKGLDKIVLRDDTDATIAGSNIGVIYKHGAYQMSDFIADWNKYYYGTAGESNYIPYLNITVTGVDGNNPSLTNVKLVDNSVVAYVVTVSPATNYEWAEDQGLTPNEEITFYITINQLALEIEWSENSLSTVYGTAANPVWTVTNKGNDKVGIEFVYKKSIDSLDELTSITNAGEYVIAVSKRIGDDKDNYTLDGATGLTADYVIKKQGLVKPTTNGYNGTFNGQVQTTADSLYSNGNALNKDAFTAIVYGKRPADWFIKGFESGATDQAFATTDLSKYAFDAKTGKFTFYNAGYYAVTFTITDSANYFWNGDGKDTDFAYSGSGYTYEWDYSFAHIERDAKTIVAPRLTGEDYNYRAMEWGSPIADLSSTVFAGSNVTNIVYSVMYGSVSIDSGTITYGAAQGSQAGGIGAVDASARGEYYALLTIDGDDMYNYVWGVDSDDTEGNTYVTRTAYITYTRAGGSQVYLHYAITASQLPIFYELLKDNYIFGANGSHIGANENTAIIGIDDILEMTGTEADIAIAKENGTISYAFYLAGTETPYTDIVNGLPWDAGKYDVRITITFPKESDYSTLTIRTNDKREKLTLTVDKRTIEVEWTFGNGDDAQTGTTLIKTYNGVGEIPEAKVVNMPSKETLGDTAAPVLKLNYEAKNLVNANETGYTLVAELDSDEVNFENSAQSLRQAKFIINKATLHISGKSPAINHVYGDSLEVYNSTENYANYFELKEGETIYSRDGKVIDITIQSADGTILTSNLIAAGKEYYVVPTLSTSATNYILEASANGEGNKFTVDKRQITVTINSNAQGTLATSVYGTAPIDINNNAGIYNVSTTNGVTATGIPSGANVNDVLVFECLKDGVAISNKTDVGSYDISCSLTAEAADNYLLTYETEQYVIVAAQITDIQVQGYTGVYNAKNNNILAVNTAQVVNDELAQNALVWWFSTDGTNWTEYTLDGNGVANEVVRNVVNAKQYFVKVSAGNNFEESSSQQITVTVTKATLKVSVNMTIRFGEHGPDQHGNDGLWYNQSIDDLRVENGIYKVEGLLEDDADRFYKRAGYEIDFFYNLNNNLFSYGYKSGEEYVRGNDVGSYTLVFDPNGLECDNYIFEGKNGVLTVEQLPVSVTLVEDVMTAVYGTHPELLQVNNTYIASITTKTKSYYDDTATIDIDGMSLDKFIYGITTTALKSSNNKVTTANVGSYPIKVNLVNKNCIWEVNGEPVTQYVITQATNVIVGEYTLFANASATNKEDEFAALANAWTYGDYSSVHTNGYNPSSGGNHALNTLDLVFKGMPLTITISRGDISVSGTAFDSANGNKTATEVLVSLFDEMHSATDEKGLYAGDYTVTYSMDDSVNYKPYQETWYFRVGKQQLTITPSNLSVVYGEGLGTATVTDVNKDGLIDATEGNPYPYYVQGLVGHNGNGIIDILDNVVSVSFTSDYVQGYENGSRIDGGYAILRVLVDADLACNYEINEYQNTSAVTVLQRDITIKVDSTLSNSFNLRTFENGRYVDETAEVYRFTLVDGTFASGDYATEIIKDGNSVEYTLQNVFVLDSYAFEHDSVADLGADYKTNHAGKYPIYLLAGEHFGKNGLANYNITIVDTAFNGSDEEKTKVPDSGVLSETYGTFTIVKAKLDIAIIGPYIDSIDGGLYANDSAERITYDAKHKVFGVQQDGDVIVPIAINYYLGTGSDKVATTGNEAPIDVGTYTIECVVNSSDYEAASSTTTHTIIPRAINIVGGDIADVIFQGKDFADTVMFNSMLNGVALDEVLVVDVVSASGIPSSTDSIANDVKEKLTACTAVAGDNSVTITARNAGTYSITVKLADNGTFKANNYLFTKGDTSDKYVLSGDRTQVTFTRNIAQATLTVGIKNTTIQYGNALTDSIFTPDYKMSWQTGSFVNDTEAQAIITAESTNGFFVESGLTYINNTKNTVTGNAYRVTDIVGNRYNVTPQGLVAYNFTVNYDNSGELEVIKRDLQIKVLGYGDKANHATTKYIGQFDPLRGVNVVSAGYLAVNNGYSLVNGNQLNALGITLSVDGKNTGNVITYNADETPYTISYSVEANDVNSNYNIVFVKNDGTTVIDNKNDTTKPTYLISKAPLTIKPVAQNVEYGKELNTILTDGVAHSWSYVDTRRFVEFDGFVNNENYDAISAYVGSNNNFLFTTNYVPYNSHVGDMVTIKLDGSVLEFTNYEVTLATAVVTVNSRIVTAEVTNPEQVYGEDVVDGVIDYHDGKYGKSHEAVIKFGGYGNDSYKPAYTLSYNTSANASLNQSANAAPTIVGDYVVNVILAKNGNNRYDYVFESNASSKALDFSVIPQPLSAGWKNTSIACSGADTDDLENTVNGFINAIMRVSRFEKDVRGTVTTITSWVDGDKTDKYIADNDGLRILASNEGTYSVVLELLSTAMHNYRWDDNSADKTCIFYVVTTKVTISNFTWESWTYDEDEPEINRTIFVSNGDVNGVKFTFGRIPGSYTGSIDDLRNNKELMATLVDCNMTFMPTDAGRYIVKAEYPTVNTGSSVIGGDTAYYAFEVYKKAISIPVSPDSVKFNNKTQSATVEIDRKFIAIDSYSDNAISVVVTSAGAIITASSVGDYKIEFILANNTNYRWVDSETDSSDIRVVTWKITKADDNKITFGQYDDVAYGSPYSIIASSEYGGAIAANNIYYADSASKPSSESPLWTTKKPTGRGTYWIKAVAEGTVNYDRAELISATPFEITKGTLTVIPTGTMVYGDAFVNVSDKYSWRVTSGLIIGEDESVVKVVGEVSYNTVNNPTLNVGSYDFVLVSQDGYVVGLEADNYDIVSGTGSLTVTPRELTVTIGTASSEYGMPTVLDPDKLLSYSETVIEGNNLNIVLTTTASPDADGIAKPVGGYSITATYSSANYIVTFNAGVYTVTQRQVIIGYENDLGGEFKSVQNADIDACTITTKLGNGTYSASDIGLVLTYAGVENNGKTYAANTVAPTNAGSYNISASCTNGNFIIADTPAHQFVISKKSIDGSKLSFDSVEYTGTTVDQFNIIDNDYNIDGDEIYTVVKRTDIVNAGTYYITLKLTDANNYKWAAVEIDTREIEFTVSKATLRVTPNGEMTYGQQLSEATYTYVINGDDLLGKDIGADVKNIVNVNNNLVGYQLVTAVTGLLDANADGYELTMVTENGNVTGLTSQNYNIVLSESYGVLVVKQRDISLQIIDSTSVYGEEVKLSQTYIVLSGSVIDGDDIGFTPVRDSDRVDYGTYVVDATITNSNYNAVEIKQGKHIIVKVRVAVSIHATDGEYGRTPATISVLNIVTTNLSGAQQTVTEKLKCVYSYSGTVQGSNTSTNFGSTMPTNAGRYIVNLVSIDDDNYELDTTQGILNAMFLIRQKEINASDLVVNSPAYTGTAQKPQVTVPDEYRDMFYEDNVLVFEQDNSVFTIVGRHTFTLTLKAEYANNYKWASSDVATRNVDFIIVKANNGLVGDDIVIPEWVYGNIVGTPQAEAISGSDAKIIYEYSSDGVNYTTSIPTLAGDYYLRATIEATDNYNAYVSPVPKKFTIAQATIEVSPTINVVTEGIEKNDVYTGGQLISTIDGFNTKVMDMPKVDNNDPNVIVRVSGGSVMLLAVNAGTYTVRFPLLDADNYKWNTVDGATIENNEVVLKWTINKKKVEAPDMSSKTLYVTGSDVTFLPEGYNPAIMSIEGNVSGYSGTFKAVISLKDSANYEWADAKLVGKDIEIEWKIVGVNLVFVIIISVISSMCVTLAFTALVLYLRKRGKVRAEARAIDRRSKADGWTGEENNDTTDSNSEGGND